MSMAAPFPYFGGKRTIAAEVWMRFGAPKQYIEPFCGSAAILLSARKPAPLEVVCDINGFIANFWRAVKYQPDQVAFHADYPVSHIDLGARHGWLIAQRDRLGAELQDPSWPGDAKVAGWWLWGQCSWIGSGWCEWEKEAGQVPHAGNAGTGDLILLTSAGRTAWRWLQHLADRLERVRIMHGDWSRCLNSHYGGEETAIFLDPPYRGYEEIYAVAPTAEAVARWAKDNAALRIALCGRAGDYDLPGWEAVRWSRNSFTYGGGKTRDDECVWYSPACLAAPKQLTLFEATA